MTHQEIVAAAKSVSSRVAHDQERHDSILLLNAKGTVRWCLSPACDGDGWLAQWQTLYQDDPSEPTVSEWLSDDEAEQEVHSLGDVHRLCRELGWV